MRGAGVRLQLVSNRPHHLERLVHRHLLAPVGPQHLVKRLRAHVFLCMLAYYVDWHMRSKLAPVLFDHLCLTPDLTVA